MSKAALLGLFLCSVFPSTSLAGPPPVITAQPLDQTVVYGGTAVFTVVATSGTAMSYQWYKRELVLILWVDTELSGQTSSTFTITDVGNSDEGTYFVKVRNAGGTVSSSYVSLNAVANTAPVANNNNYTTLEDVPLIIPAAGILTNDTDINGQTLTAVLVTNVTHGSLILNSNGGFTYLPDTNYNGTDSFRYRANDGITSGNLATVTINVIPVNDPPRPNNDSTNTLEDASVTVKVLVNDSDAEGTPLTVTGSSTASGTTFISDNNIIFTPTTNFNGAAAISYTVSDGTNSVTANVTVTVTPVNDTPVANNDTYTTPEDVPLALVTDGILSNDVDVDGDALTALLVSDVSHGSLTFNNNGRFSYSPKANYHGSDSFTYRVMDGGVVVGDVATVTINVTPVNDTPVAVNDAYTTSRDSHLTVSSPGLLVNDTDVEDGPLTVQLVDNASHGSVTLNPDGSFIYAPGSNYFGSDSFTYRVMDGLTAGNVATVNLTIANSGPLSFNSGVMTVNGFRMQLSGPTANAYLIEASSDMRDWTPISTNSALNGTVEFTDGLATNYPLRFYRAKLR